MQSSYYKEEKRLTRFREICIRCVVPRACVYSMDLNKLCKLFYYFYTAGPGRHFPEPEGHKF